MTQMIEPTTVTASIEVNAPQQRAFEVFTRDFGVFKPREHNLLAVPIDVVRPVDDRGDAGVERPAHPRDVLAERPRRLLCQ